MSQYSNYEELNRIEEFSMIAGGTRTLTFNTYQSDGVTPLVITGATVYWVLAPFGQLSANVLQKTGTVSAASTFTVSLAAADTEDLPSGKYIYQPVIVAGAVTYRPTQGSILIQSAIPVV